ncbi:PTS fructose transporter subunit IIABC [Corynebacterium variabile]|uniref:Phosphotransferase system, fructose-specific IIC component n=4 Tax=Corynebacterium variabile TaxID=1727 RepID=A0A0X8XV29_9CORY|nr:fructose-specific PTS transporter subunit EIIC [Corynebacterium variabile]AEK37465.1 PTS system fructose-specific component II [Corynebacterium variabile DSM 44702]GEC84997.1 phosphotransferase system, fructose-specific IIC component [Corynebacterium variabile]CUU64713.1 PTS system D-fructose-specific IIA component (F1P-forming), Frc family (TC 4.A.2.1.4) / PTS system D-fructose-specific IIB component (F1P-forming), Frc family (TC 4.A.2.1.4) / PTS system D-fructose-specific IIC component (F1P
MTTPEDSADRPVLIPELVSLDAGLPADKDVVLNALADLQVDAGRATDATVLLGDIHAREAQAATGLPGGIAIPHCRTTAVDAPSLGVARLSEPTDFGAEDGPADLVFMILAPAGAGKEHLKILSTLARSLVKKDYVEALRSASSEEEVVALVTEKLNAKKKKKASADPEATPEAPAATTAATAGSAQDKTPQAAPAKKVTKLVGVTSCPTGIAHTYMAADALTGAADNRDDVEIVIETQGSSGTGKLTKEQIEEADAVIFAHGVAVREIERFAGKPVVDVPVKKGISEPEELINRAIEASTAENPRRVAASGGGESGGDDEDVGNLGWGSRIQQAVMTGVSYMVPFVAAGGLLMALGFLIGGYNVSNVWETAVKDFSLWNLPDHLDYMMDGSEETFSSDRSGLLLYLGAVFFGGGTTAMSFLVPALSGYTAYALAGRPGIVPGFVGGAISLTVGAGFIGGLITGIIAGLAAMWIQSYKVPRWLASMMPVVIIPLVATLITAASMFLVLGRPLAAIMDGLQNWLTDMSDSSAWLLGIILGLMMCFDLGGPVNKAAYLFATAGLSTGDDAALKIMAAVIAAGMVPPLALALATTVRPKLWTKDEKENGKASWLLGASFISEGAIPFAAADPLRIIPSMMVGGAVTGAISMQLGAMSRAPHGGFWVAPLMDNAWGFVLAVVVGTLVSAVTVIIVKQVTGKKDAAAASDSTQEAAAPATA